MQCHTVCSSGHCTITVPSLHHHCAITAPSLRHHFPGPRVSSGTAEQSRATPTTAAAAAAAPQRGLAGSTIGDASMGEANLLNCHCAGTVPPLFQSLYWHWHGAITVSSLQAILQRHLAGGPITALPSLYQPCTSIPVPFLHHHCTITVPPHRSRGVPPCRTTTIIQPRDAANPPRCRRRGR